MKLLMSKYGLLTMLLRLGLNHDITKEGLVSLPTFVHSILNAAHFKCSHSVVIQKEHCRQGKRSALIT